MHLSPETEREIKRLADRGQRIEAQWTSFREICIGSIPEWMLDPLRAVFFAGACAALDVVFNQTSDADEVTEDDRRLMMALQDEIEVFRAEAMLRAMPLGTEH